MRVLDVITGLLLLVVVAAQLYVIVRVLLWRHIAALFSRVAADENKPVNSHLIGTTGQLLSVGDGLPDSRIRVRIGMERWDATWSGDVPDAPAEGGEVRIVGVNGMTLLVIPAESDTHAQRQSDESGEAPSQGARPGDPPFAEGEALRT